MDNKQSNNQPDWVWVLGCKDLLRHFSVSELKQFSTLCRNLRNKLKPYLFNHLNLSEYNPRDSGFLNQNTGIKSSTNHKPMDTVQLNFKPFVQYIFGLTFGFYFTDPMLITIPTIFHNLKLLRLHNLVISLPSLHQLIHGFNSLESLSLDSLIILVWLEIKPSLIQFTFPESLKKLAIVRCRRIDAEYNSDLFNQSTEDLIQYRHTDFCHFPGQFLPNLKELKIYEIPPAILMQNEFLSFNLQLTFLQTRFFLLNQASFDYLNLSQHLTHLQIGSLSGSLENINQLLIPPLNQIETLTFVHNCENMIPSIIKLSLLCPNLTHLTVRFIQEFATSLNEIVLRLQHLEGITIIGYSEDELILDMDISWNKLKYIELHWFEPLEIDLTKFQSCTELKRVIIKFSKYETHDMSVIVAHYQNFQGWNCLFFHDSIQCYKT